LSKKKKNQPKPTSQAKPAKKKKKKDDTWAGKTIAENRKARHNYELLEKIECGIVLHGS